jgi:UDP-N-acetylmuramoyl-L-alanyl-D-glutamate--2,6-diaminopimelate ligase
MPPPLPLADALRNTELLRRMGGDPSITAVEYDSRRVTPGALFVAMRGETTDGNRYIEQAVARGAVAVVTDSAAAYDATVNGPLDVAVAEVPHGRRALATIAANVFGHPEQHLALSGVTGTNGKTTTAYLLEQLLRAAGRTTALVGTIEYRLAGEVRPAPHTTPESRDLYALLAEGVARHVTEAVMEVSSHALDQGRVWGVPYDGAIFTNLTQDHLDYHGTMEAYFAAKRKLFDGSQAPAPRVAVLNAEDDAAAVLAETAQAAGSTICTYGVDRGDFHASDLRLRPNGMSLRIHTPQGDSPLDVPLTGRVNVLNLLAATAAAMTRGLSLDQIATAVPRLQAVPGRFEAVTVSCSSAPQPFTVVVDYAHTDDALRNVLTLARALVAPQHGRVITVFGCGGDRDRTKRPRMGRAAASLSEIVIITSDNPRSEDPRAIIDQILPGTAFVSGPANTSTVHSTTQRATVEVEPDRAKAIALAITKAHPGDIVVIAGKGHEKTQTIGNSVLPFDDVAVAREALTYWKGKS